MFRNFMLVCCLLVLAACWGRGPIDAALDALEQALTTVENRIGDYHKALADPGAKDQQKSIFDQLAKDGMALQMAYTPVLNLELPKLSQDQERRRSDLRQRAMAAAADLIDLNMPKTNKANSP